MNQNKMSRELLDNSLDEFCKDFSYMDTRYVEGIEIEVDTVPEERRKHLATIVCSALILNRTSSID